MPLTDAQIAEEKAWVEQFFKAMLNDPEEWAAFYSGGPPVKGKANILKFCKFTHAQFAQMRASNIVISVDEANSRIVVTNESSAILIADPEKKVLSFRWAGIFEKPLGVGAKQILHDEAISDPTPVFKRVMELGLDPAAMIGEILA